MIISLTDQEVKTDAMDFFQNFSLVTKTEFDVVSCDFIKFVIFSHNRNKVSEDFEHLCLKYAERYIGAETQSSCTVFDSNPPSSQKRKMSKPRWSVKSPGRRLSHLARRRITFSSANLQANSSSAILGSRARQILVDARYCARNVCFFFVSFCILVGNSVR